MATVSIYGLHDPVSGELRYIGKANDPAARLKSHLRDARRRRTPVYGWIRKLVDQGMVPEMRVLERVEASDWPEAERRLIQAHGSNRLLNLAEGGNEPYCPREVRQQNGKRNVAAIQADPFRKRLWEIKRALGYAFKAGQLKERHLDAMRKAAQCAPHIFGCWAGV